MIGSSVTIHVNCLDTDHLWHVTGISVRTDTFSILSYVEDAGRFAVDAKISATVRTIDDGQLLRSI